MDWASVLKDQLRERAQSWARRPGVASYGSRGTPATVLFPRSVDGDSHGNFFPDAWSAIRSNPDWSCRLEKAHAQSAALPLEYQATAKELDSSNSSDALLMNCFCYPGSPSRLARALGASLDDAIPEFGHRARILLSDESTDATEVDMLLGDTFVEAKLTEKDFTSKPKAQVRRYSAFPDTFDVDLLPADEEHFHGYQLIRNVLAAAQHNRKLIVLLDARRPDLLEQWWQVHAAISAGELRARCAVRFWQQLAAASAPDHHNLLEQKYGV